MLELAHLSWLCLYLPTLYSVIHVGNSKLVTSGFIYIMEIGKVYNSGLLFLFMFGEGEYPIIKDLLHHNAFPE